MKFLIVFSFCLRVFLFSEFCRKMSSCSSDIVSFLFFFAFGSSSSLSFLSLILIALEYFLVSMLVC